jgi:hypothetical protein
MKDKDYSISTIELVLRKMLQNEINNIHKMCNRDIMKLKNNINNIYDHLIVLSSNKQTIKILELAKQTLKERIDNEYTKQNSLREELYEQYLYNDLGGM